MVRYHTREKESAWRRRRVINFVAGVYTALVVVIFAIVKFTYGAWLVVVIFPIGVIAFIWLNREYRLEAQVLETISSRAAPPTPPTYSRRAVYVFVDEFDLATLAALRYARSLRPTSIRAVHFVLDSAQATKLRQDWLRANTGIALDLVDCPDRRLARAAAEMVRAEALHPGVGVTAVLPRRSYAPLLGRLLHDRTADKLASVISQIPHAAATIVPFDVRSRVESLAGRARERAAADGQAAVSGVKPGEGADAAPDRAAEQAEAAAAIPADSSAARAAAATMPPDPATSSLTSSGGTEYNRPVPSGQATPIGQLPNRGHAVIEGRVHAVEIRPVERNTVLACEIVDSTGRLTAMFYGRSHIPGLNPGAKVRFTGRVGMRGAEPVMINPAYELLAPGHGSGH
jgi:hypothetical protein